MGKRKPGRNLKEKLNNWTTINAKSEDNTSTQRRERDL
jgi:hypothetical protein